MSLSVPVEGNIIVSNSESFQTLTRATEEIQSIESVEPDESLPEQVVECDEPIKSQESIAEPDEQMSVPVEDNIVSNSTSVQTLGPAKEVVQSVESVEPHESLPEQVVECDEPIKSQESIAEPDEQMSVPVEDNIVSNSTSVQTLGPAKEVVQSVESVEPHESLPEQV
eukprot:329681_1